MHCLICHDEEGTLEPWHAECCAALFHHDCAEKCRSIRGTSCPHCRVDPEPKKPLATVIFQSIVNLLGGTAVTGDMVRERFPPPPPVIHAGEIVRARVRNQPIFSVQDVWERQNPDIDWEAFRRRTPDYNASDSYLDAHLRYDQLRGGVSGSVPRGRIMHVRQAWGILNPGRDYEAFKSNPRFKETYSYKEALEFYRDHAQYRGGGGGFY